MLVKGATGNTSCPWTSSVGWNENISVLCLSQYDYFGHGHHICNCTANYIYKDHFVYVFGEFPSSPARELNGHDIIQKPCIGGAQLMNRCTKINVTVAMGISPDVIVILLFVDLKKHTSDSILTVPRHDGIILFTFRNLWDVFIWKFFTYVCLKWVCFVYFQFSLKAKYNIFDPLAWKAKGVLPLPVSVSLSIFPSIGNLYPVLWQLITDLIWDHQICNKHASWDTLIWFWKWGSLTLTFKIILDILMQNSMSAW